MDRTLSICLTCLSKDRCLVPLNKLTMLLLEIHFLELKVSYGGVCWECWSILFKFHRFKNKVKIAQDILSQNTEHNNIKSLSTLTSKIKIFYDYEYTHSFDPLTNCNEQLKAEPQIKQELIDQSDDNIDNTSDFNEESEHVYDIIIEPKHGDFNTNVLKNQEIITQNTNNSVDENFDSEETKLNIDEKLCDIPKLTKNIYTDMLDTKHNNKLFKKQKYLQCVNGVQIKIDQSNEKLSKVQIQNVDAETLEKKSSKHRLKIEKPKRDLEEDAEEFQEKFTRVVLSQEEMLRVREEKRNQYNFKKVPYKCDSCVLGFMKKDTYSLHMQKKHDESIGDQICDVCSTRFRHKLALINHKNKHYVLYRCRLCKYEIHEFVSAMNHCKSKHVDDKLDRIHCSQCSVVVKTPEDLQAHMQTDHSLYCECGIKFKDKNNLRQHIRCIIDSNRRSKHTAGRCQRVQSCLYARRGINRNRVTAAQAVKQRKEQGRSHSGLRNFICDICKKTFKTKTRLETHMVGHSGNIAKKLAYCQQCNVQYKTIQVYRNHLKTSANHSEGHPCSECNKKFRSKGYLRQHVNFYHLRKSQFKCEVCNKIFISNWRLRNHKQQYHGLSRPRNHSCNTCAKKFFTLATLRSHQLTHSDQRSFMCEDCGDTFKQSAALYTHTRLVHKGGGSKKKRDC